MNINFIDMRNKLPINPDPNRKYHKRKYNKINTLVLHCDDWDADLETVATYDVTPNPDHHISPKGCPEYTYHFFVEKNGDTFYTVDIKKVTWHAGNHNTKSIAACIRYRATGNHNPPPEEQLQAVYNLFSYLCLKLAIDPDNIKGHRELPDTGYYIVNGVKKLRKTCPGMLINMDKVRYMVGMNVQSVLKKLGFYKGRIDGLFGPKSEKALLDYANRGD